MCVGKSGGGWWIVRQKQGSERGRDEEGRGPPKESGSADHKGVQLSEPLSQLVQEFTALYCATRTGIPSEMLILPLTSS